MSTLKTNIILDAAGGNTTQINGMIPVGTTATQTLTNKTLTSPTLSDITVTGTISANSSVGSAGQVLTSNTTGLYWSTMPSGITNLSLTANSSTISINSDTGTDVTILAANSTTSGVLTADAQTIGGTKTFTTSIDSNITFSAFASSTALTLGYAGVAESVTNISTGVTATSINKTVNLGTSGGAGSITNINIGSANGGTTTINSTNVVIPTITNSLTVIRNMINLTLMGY